MSSAITPAGQLDDTPAAQDFLARLRAGVMATGIACRALPTGELVVDRTRAEEVQDMAVKLRLVRLRGAGHRPEGCVDYLGFDHEQDRLVVVRVLPRPVPLEGSVRNPAATGAAAALDRPAGGGRPVPATGGVVVAFVGCDGSGKSTVTEVVGRWFGEQLRVERMYLGSGEGSSSLLRWPLLMAHRLATRLRTRRRGAQPTSTAVTPDSDRPAPPRRGLRRWLLPVWALALSREKRLKLRTVSRWRAAGALVICDRYPQNEIMGFNDGPLLDGWRGRLLPSRLLAGRERAPYVWAEQHPPDLIVKLRVSPTVALQRKPDMSADEVRRRTAAIDALRFGAAKTLVVDADAPLDQVLRRVKEGIWAELRR